ncbi:MAG: hypothetical protein JNK45_21530 [Myxococcales bacterium]|nr:hypothetical protein [Myxococcales bacterium]
MFRAGACAAAAKSGIAILLASSSACGGGSDAGDSSETDAASTGAVDLPMPDFLEPANGELKLEADRIQDVTLDVSAQAGVTRLVLDGESVGTLGAGSTIGAFEPDALRLFVRGALVPGVHTLSMRTPDAVESETSEVVTVFIEAVPVPTWRFEPAASLAVGDALVVGPSGAAALGLVVDDGATSSLRAWPPDADGWDLDAPRELALPGHAAAGSEAAVAIEHRPGADGDDRLRVAWTVGRPGAGIGVVEVDWSGADDGTVRSGFVPDPTWLGTREWSEIGRPVLAGPLVLAEVTALVDTERAHPGDRVLGFAPFSSLEQAPPQWLPVGATDLDRVGHVLSSIVGDVTAIGLRVDHLRPAVLEVEGTGAVRLRPSDAVVDDPRWGDVEGPLLTATGAFHSRIVAGLHRDRDALVFAWFADGGGANEPTIRIVAFPDAAKATGAPTLALVDGIAIVLVPRGEADALAVTMASDSPVVQTLSGAACDGLAAPRGDVGNAAARVEVACLRARELSVGVLLPDADG